MGFEYGRNYTLYVILGDPSYPKLWEWAQWSKLVPILNPLVMRSRGPASVQSTQSQSEGGSARKLGKIGWNEKGHRKWTHNLSDHGEDSHSWKFLQMEIWAPSRQQCARDKRPPDFWFAFRNEGYWGGSALRFNPLMLMGIPEDMARSFPGESEKVVKMVSGHLGAVFVAWQSRPWGHSLGSSGYSNFIGDLVTTGLFKPGTRQRDPLNLSMFEEQWKVLE